MDKINPNVRIGHVHLKVADLKRANGLRDSRIFAGRSYKIPRRGGVAVPTKLVLPARRVPGISPEFEPDTSVQSASVQ